jgi:hypothetical protein
MISTNLLQYNEYNAAVFAPRDVCFRHEYLTIRNLPPSCGDAEMEQRIGTEWDAGSTIEALARKYNCTTPVFKYADTASRCFLEWRWRTIEVAWLAKAPVLHSVQRTRLSFSTCDIT